MYYDIDYFVVAVVETQLLGRISMFYGLDLLSVLHERSRHILFYLLYPGLVHLEIQSVQYNPSMFLQFKVKNTLSIS